MGHRSFIVIFTSLSLILAGSFAAQAQDSANQTKEKLVNVAPSTANKVDDETNVDDIITNANLRAYSGSKSKWSIASVFNYDGGTINAPFAEQRPNIAGSSGVSNDTDINGQLNVKYNLNSTNSLLLGFGIRKMAPFVATGPSTSFYAQGGKDMDVFDPSLTYQYIYKIGKVQAVLQVAANQFTRADFVSATGQNWDKGISIDQENIMELGNSGFSVGGSIGASGATPSDYSQDYSRYQYWLTPYLEYAFSETYNFRTVLTLWDYEQYAGPTGFIQDKVTQSLGVTITLTRDIVLYPNVQYQPDHITAGLTNVGMTATVNLF